MRGLAVSEVAAVAEAWTTVHAAGDRAVSKVVGHASMALAGHDHAFLVQAWRQEDRCDGSKVLACHKESYALSGEGELLALFRCVSSRTRASTAFVAGATGPGSLTLAFSRSEAHGGGTFRTSRPAALTDKPEHDYEPDVFTIAAFPLWFSSWTVEPNAVLEIVIGGSSVQLSDVFSLVKEAAFAGGMRTSATLCPESSLGDPRIAAVLSQWPLTDFSLALAFRAAPTASLLREVGSEVGPLELMASATRAASLADTKQQAAIVPGELSVTRSCYLQSEETQSQAVDVRSAVATGPPFLVDVPVAPHLPQCFRQRSHPSALPSPPDTPPSFNDVVTAMQTTRASAFDNQLAVCTLSGASAERSFAARCAADLPASAFQEDFSERDVASGSLRPVPSGLQLDGGGGMAGALTLLAGIERAAGSVSSDLDDNCTRLNAVHLPVAPAAASAEPGEVAEAAGVWMQHMPVVHGAGCVDEVTSRMLRMAAWGSTSSVGSAAATADLKAWLAAAAGPALTRANATAADNILHAAETAEGPPNSGHRPGSQDDTSRRLQGLSLLPLLAPPTVAC